LLNIPPINACHCVNMLMECRGQQKVTVSETVQLVLPVLLPQVLIMPSHHSGRFTL